MKIAIIIGAFLPVPPALGGAVEKLWWAKAIEFSKLGHAVTMISRRYKGYLKSEVVDGVAHRRVRGFTTPKSIYVRLIKDFFYSLMACLAVPKDADVIVTNTFFSPIILPWLRTGLIYIDVARMPKGQLRWYPRDVWFRANSSAVYSAVLSELGRSSSERVSIIPNPLPFQPITQFSNPSSSTALFVGRVHPEKGLDLLVPTALYLATRGWKLKVVGPWNIEAGGGGDAYKSLLDERFRGLPVEFVGPVYDAEHLAAVYRDCSIFLYPSIAAKGETFGLAPLEAMSYGAVPVVSNLQCFSDFIKSGYNGLTFDIDVEDAGVEAAAKVASLVSNPELLLSMSAKCILVNQSHSVSNVSLEFVSDFDRALLWRDRL